MLIEHLLQGLGSPAICDELIAKKPTTFSEAYELAESTSQVAETANDYEQSEQLNKIARVGEAKAIGRKLIDVFVNGKKVQMELYTGAHCR